MARSSLYSQNYDNIVGYDILNEPHPERLYDTNSTNIDQVEQDKVQKMLSSFYNNIIISIREIDQSTPIIIESSAYGIPACFDNLYISRDPNIIYSFHMYEPYSYINAQINMEK